MRRTLAALATLCALAAPSASRAFEWPAAPPQPADPLERFRWDRISAWQAASAVELRSTLVRLDAGPHSAVSAARRAVVLRLLRRDDEARAALREALNTDTTHAVYDDPDVALTGAWLAARLGDWNEAAALGLRALARMPPATLQLAPHREALVLEIARWSMARGPAGLEDALRVLRASTANVAASPMLRATMTLALARQGRTDEADAVAAGARVTLHPSDATDTLPRGALLPAEAAAAVGATLLRTGRGREALAVLTAAASACVPAWRVFQEAELARARRAAP